MRPLIPIACLALPGTAGPALAQSGQPPSPTNASPTTGKIQQVNVSGARADDTETRRLSSANNLDPRSYDSARSVDTGSLVQSAVTATRTYPTLGIRYEMKM
jgi:iron complex outermembrane receptor protein